MPREPTRDHWTEPGSNIDEIFARRVRETRLAAGLTQLQLTERMAAAGYKVHRSVIAKIESGDRVVPVGEAVVIAAALGVALNDLTADPGTILPVRAGAWPLMDFISEIRKMIETQQAAYGDAADKLTDFELRLGKLGLELRPSGPKEG